MADVKAKPMATRGGVGRGGGDRDKSHIFLEKKKKRESFIL